MSLISATSVQSLEGSLSFLVHLVAFSPYTIFIYKYVAALALGVFPLSSMKVWVPVQAWAFPSYLSRYRLPRACHALQSNMI